MIKHHPRKPPASSFMGLLGSKSLARIPGKGSQDGLDQLHTPLANRQLQGQEPTSPTWHHGISGRGVATLMTSHGGCHNGLNA